MAFQTDGFPTTIDLSGGVLCEVEVTPPGIDGGGENDVTCMRNTEWRTRFPKKLKTLTEASFTAFYDPEAYDTLLADLQVNQLVTITFPDGDTLAFWGWIDMFEPDASVEGEAPQATVTIIPSNLDGSQEEVAPVLTPYGS